MSLAANQVYYFEIGKGDWLGEFSLRITDWKAFWSDKISVFNRFLSLSMWFVSKTLGPSKIRCHLVAHPSEGEFGVCTNSVVISKCGISLWVSQERYILDPNGTGVTVQAHERFGPIPFLFKEYVEYPATINPGGMSSTYALPILGTQLTVRYQVDPDRNHVRGNLDGKWTHADEVLNRVVLENSI